MSTDTPFFTHNEAQVEVWGIPPNDPTYPGRWKRVAVPDDSLCPEPIPNSIDYGTPRTAAQKAQYAKDNSYNLNVANHVLGNTLISDIANGKPQNQIPICGENITAAQRENLNRSLR